MSDSLSTNQGPVPGDIFRNHTYNAETIIEIAPAADHPSPRLGKRKLVSGRPRSLDIWDLEDAVKAEVALEFWGGHIATSDHKLRVNHGDWIPIPQIEGTPTNPLCYMRNLLGSAIVPIPLSQLRPGTNVFEFACGPQVAHRLTWGIFKVYAFTIRIYYNESKPHATGRIKSHVEGETIDEFPVFKAEAWGSPGNDSKLEFTPSDVARVEYVGLYTDFNWEGNGVFRQWHYQLIQGQLDHHIGSGTEAPYRVKWKTKWVPDQSEPIKLSAFVTDTHGIIFMTPAVGLILDRPRRSVRMYPAHEIPEYFAVRAGNRMSCKITVADDPSNASAGRLFLSTWAGGHANALGLNDHKLADQIGRNDFYSYDSIEVEPSILHQGENTFFVFSDTTHHAAEINWPGPVLMLAYPK